LIESSAPVRQAALERAARLENGNREALSVCLARELDSAVQPSAEARMLALDSLRRIARANEHVDEIMAQFLSSPDDNEAALAAEVVSPYGTELAEYAQKLGKEFASDKPLRRRLLSGWLLTKTGVSSRNAEDSVRPLLKNSDPRLRAWAAGAIAYMYPEQPEKTSVRDIVGLFRYDENFANLVLSQLDLDGSKTVSLLRPVLSDPDPELRAACALVLGGMGEKAKDAVPDLMRLLESADGKTAYAAAQALGGVGAPALDPLFECIDGGSAADKCVSALAWSGSHAIEKLKGGLSARNSENLRLNSAQALGSMAAQLLMPQAGMFYQDPQAAFDSLRQTLPALQKNAETDSSAQARAAARAAVEAIRKGIPAE
jgi:HEAT repeat protein